MNCCENKKLRPILTDAGCVMDEDGHILIECINCGKIFEFENCYPKDMVVDGDNAGPFEVPYKHG